MATLKNPDTDLINEFTKIFKSLLWEMKRRGLNALNNLKIYIQWIIIVK